MHIELGRIEDADRIPSLSILLAMMKLLCFVPVGAIPVPENWWVFHNHTVLMKE
jgi:hypothetical protein